MITSIKLEEKTIELNGKTYVLHVNMSVLDRIQEACGGEITAMLTKTVSESNAITMTAMLNDYAEDMGWEEVWTEKKVKKYFNSAMMRMLDVPGMFFRAIRPDRQDNGPKTEDGNPDENSGN